MTQGARGHRAGGSEDPPLQLVDGAEVGMAGTPGNAALAAVDKGERTQRGTVLGATWKFSRKKILILGFLGEPRGGEAYF